MIWCILTYFRWFLLLQFVIFFKITQDLIFWCSFLIALINSLEKTGIIFNSLLLGAILNLLNIACWIKKKFSLLESSIFVNYYWILIEYSNTVRLPRWLHLVMLLTILYQRVVYSLLTLTTLLLLHVAMFNCLFTLVLIIRSFRIICISQILAVLVPMSLLLVWNLRIVNLILIVWIL